MRRLAQLQLLKIVGEAPGDRRQRKLPRVDLRRDDMHHQAVAAVGHRQRKGVGDKHIFRFSQQFAVQIDLGGGINAAEFQQGIAARPGGRVKLGAVPQVPVFQLLCLQHIVCVVQVLQQPLPHQIQFKISGHRGRNSAVRIGQHRGGGAQLQPLRRHLGMGDDSQTPVLDGFLHVASPLTRIIARREALCRAVLRE